MKRRGFVFVAAASAVGAASAGCGDSQSGLPPIPSKEIVVPLALVGIKVGDGLVKFPHPVARIIGVVLKVSGTLIVTYVSLEEWSKQKMEVSIDQREVEKLKGTCAKIQAQTQSGEIEHVTVSEVKYDNSAFGGWDQR